MSQKNILIAEDDKDISEILSLYLKKNNFEVYTAENGKIALDIMNKNKIDIAIIDIMMPVVNGYELIEKIRKTNQIPIIIVSAKNMIEDKVQGLNIGADAYITKPFNPTEVVETVKAIMRRCYEYTDNTPKKKIILGNLEFDEENYALKKNGVRINLTNTELKILTKMMKKPGKIFSIAELYKCIGNEYIESDANTVMVHISNIRAKLPDTEGYIKTVRGVGYKIETK